MNAPARGGKVVVVGGGPIGLSIAHRLLGVGWRVTVLDAGEPRAAWRVSAGMLSPATEAEYGREELALLSNEALAAYPAFVSELEAAAEVRIPFERTGSLAVALDRDQLEALRRRLVLLRDELRLEVQWLPAGECREREPLLSPRVAGAIHVPGDGHVDPRALVAALERAIRRRGGVIRHARADSLLVSNGAVSGVLAGDESYLGEVVVLAAGAWVGGIGSLPAPLPIRPVKGQILRLRAEPSPSALLMSDGVYVFRRSSGEVVLGATVEDRGFDPEPTAGGVLQLVEEGVRVLPSLRECVLVEVGVGFRPTAPDNAPLIGELAPGLIAACAHYRSGILLTPVTADAVAHLIERGELPPLVAPFAPDRLRRGNVPDRDHAQRQAVHALR